LTAIPAGATPQNDVVIGNGGAGPYSLTWKNILKDTVIVSENGQALTNMLDYNVDPNGGQITFTHPLSQQSTALVQYQYDPSVAQRTSTTLLSPLKFDLDQTDNRDVFLSASVTQSSNQANTNASSNVAFTLGSQWNGSGHNQIGARWYFDPSVNPSGQPDAPSKTAAGFAVTGSADAGRGSLFTFGVNRAEKSLIAGDGLQAGQQLINMGLHVAPETKVVADFGYKQTDAVDNGGPAKVESSEAVTVAPSNTMQLKAQMGQVEQSGQEAANTTSLSLTAKPVVGTGSKPGVDLTASTTQATQGDNSTQQTAVGVTVSQNQTMQLKAQIGQVDQTGQNTANTTTLSITAKPVLGTATKPGVDLTASTTQTTQGDNSTQQTAVGVTVSQNQKLTIQTGMNVQRNQDISHQVMSLNTILRPLSTMEIDAGYQSRTASSNDTNVVDSLDTRSMQLSISPARSLKLFGNYTENPADGSGTPTAMLRRGLGLQSSFGHLTVNGGYDWNRPSGASDDATSLKLGFGWKLSQSGELTGGYQQAIGNSMTNCSYPWLTQYTFGYHHNLGDAFSVSLAGTYNQHPGEAVNGSSDLSGTASLGVKF
jgi:hypothetical protein